MTITVEQIISETSIYVPPENILSQTQMETVASDLINKYGDEDSNLPTLKCEFLKAIAVINGTVASVQSGNQKREKLGEHEIEWYDGSSDPWGDYLTRVKSDICPLFGVEPIITIGATYSSEEQKPVIKSCVNKRWSI